MTASRPASRARRMTVCLATLAVSLLVYLAVAHHQLAREEWYLRRLGSDARKVRYAALAALVKMRSSRAVEPFLAAAVAGHRDPMPGWILPDSEICISGALRSKKESREDHPTPEEEATNWAQNCILAIESIGAAALPVLRRKLASESDVERAWAARLLGALGNEAHDAARDLFRLFEDPSEPVREQAANGYALIALKDPALLRDCAAIAADEKQGTIVRTSCITALGVGVLAEREAQRDGELDRPEAQISQLTLPAFEAASASRDPAIRLAAMEWTLVCFVHRRSHDDPVTWSPEARNALVQGLEDPDAGVRLRAVEIAGLAEPISKEVGGALRRRATDPSGPIREAAWRGLDKIARQTLGPPDPTPRGGPKDKRDTSTLLQRLASPNVEARRAASVSLGYRTADAVQVGPALFLALDDADARVQAEALISLSGFGGVDPSVFLRKAADLLRRSQHVEVRLAAVRVLGEAGRRAREALPELREAAATDADGTVRELAGRLAEGLEARR